MSIVIDLDAQRREVQYPHGIPVKIHGEEFLFPAEIPAACLDPLFSDELDLMGVLGDIVNADANDTTTTGEIVEMIFRRPQLPARFYGAVMGIYKELLGEATYQDFKTVRPSIGDYVRLSQALISVYGVDLGKLFRSADSSENDGATSSPTSPASTADSTPEASGSDQASPGSSASVA
ncbi:hypothetical protein KUF83_30005 [Streptomyces sp. BV286]|uniref:hypothetical protein n=1 Tax=Streptomyces sp. BV286 TaxID=2849672 RepID=UPI001C2E8B5B|nr:hypothetical protein [Streptomyces sp. BV286]MBV1940770.1 hypothetical protein [Streptomyces sp. BV286]